MARKKASGKKTSKPAQGKPNAKAGKQAKGGSEDLVNYRQMQALSKKERVHILAVFCERIASPAEISKELRWPLNQVSYHVRVLRDCGLIVLDHKEQVRGAMEHFYRAASPTLIPPGSWDSLPPSVRKGVSASILEHFLDDASTSMQAGVFDDPPGELSWTPLLLDPIGVDEFGQLARDFLEALLALQANASKRIPKGARAPQRRSRRPSSWRAFYRPEIPRTARKHQRQRGASADLNIPAQHGR